VLLGISEEAQEEAFNKLKHLTSTPPVLQYYDLSKPVTLQVDASEEGGCQQCPSPAQECRMPPAVAYISNSLNTTEQ